MSEKHKNPRDRFENLKTKKVLVGAGIAGLTLTAATLAGAESNESVNEPRPQEEKYVKLDAAREIATRFTCDLESVLDTHKQPSEETIRSTGGNPFSPERRTTLNLKVNLHDVPDAQKYIEKYGDGTPVTWDAPIVRAAVGQEPTSYGLNMLTDELAQQVRYKEEGEPDHLNVNLYPKATYPDGTYAHVYVRQDVYTSDNDSSYRTNGYISCGKVVFNGKSKTWELDSDAPKTDTYTEVEQY